MRSLTKPFLIRRIIKHPGFFPLSLFVASLTASLIILITGNATAHRPVAPGAVVRDYPVTISGVPMLCTLNVDAFGNGTLHNCTLRH